MSEEFMIQKMPPDFSNKGLVLMHQEKMRNKNLMPDDVLLIKGKNGKVAASKVRPYNPRSSRRDANNVILVDGATRHTVGKNIGEYVEVEKVDNVKEAQEVFLKTEEEFGMNMIEGIGEIIGRTVVKGQLIRASRPAVADVNIVVDETSPEGQVVEITENTRIKSVSAKGGLEADSSFKTESTEEKTSETTTNIPDVTYEDVGGLDSELDKIREMVELPLNHPELFETLGIEAPKGVLLHGPPGTGKTLLAKAVANEVDASFHVVSGPEIMSKFYGESEEKLREIFEEAEEQSPSIIFIDELDSIAPARGEVQGEVGKRVVAQLLSLMDGLEGRGNVTVLGATNRVDAVDNALRRGGRFDREIEIGVPNREDRLEILNIHTRGMPLDEEVSLEEFADQTHGFVGADLANLAKESAMSSLRRIRPDLEIGEVDEIPSEKLEEMLVTQDDFESAIKEVEPSAMREVFVEVPDISYEDIGGLKEEKQRLVESVEWPLDHAKVFEHFDSEAPKGILLYGPPGNGKTLLAKAVANASDSNFISVKGPELMNKYVGESEKGVREIFKKARQNSPTVIFFDEIDSIASERGSSTENEVSERVVSQLLTELDGLEDLSNVVVIAATNRPDIIDSALLRTGRFEDTIEINLPDKEARKEIFSVKTKNAPVSKEVDLEELATKTEGYTGSDIEAVCREASMNKMRRLISEAEGEVPDDELEDSEVTSKDFEQALEHVEKSLKEEEVEMYKGIYEKVGEIEETTVENVGRGFQ